MASSGAIGTVPGVPELPEVETIRRQLEPVVVGRVVVEAGAFESAKFTPAVQAIGAGIEAIRRRGKYLLLDLDDHRELVIHLGMTGRFLPRAVGEPLADDPYTRAWWGFDDGTGLTFRDVRRFGRIAVVPTGDHGSLPTLHRLGPEPFDDAFTPEHLWREVRASSVHVKTQLLNQRVVAGVGNIYADEALWAAQVHPMARTITRRQAAALRDTIREALALGLDTGGTTLRDYRTVEGDEGRNQHTLHCYGRSGEPCDRCGTVLRRGVVDARGTTWCPTCQRR